MSDWLEIVLGAGTATAIAILIIQAYILNRSKHNFDLKLEKLKPLTAEDILRRQNFLNSKRDAFFDEVDIVCKHLGSVPWNGPDIPMDRVLSGDRPSESEVNTCQAKLAIYSDDPEILEKFQKCFGKASSVLVGEFLNQLRKDLGYEALKVEPGNYKYIFMRDPNHEGA
ncbi:MAG: hypothetical protein JKX85_07350 [Phycisphaeraceae bacterium]|nr:hypothetical protein [Phycisphaeraceae bacterium]